MEDTSKAGEVNIEAVQGSELPPLALRDTSKEKETSQSMELVLATLPIDGANCKDHPPCSSVSFSFLYPPFLSFLLHTCILEGWC